MEERSVPPELHELAEEIGNFIQFWGFKRVHGRIWTHLCLAESPLDASDLMERLRISKALVSMSLADLLEFEVIAEAGRSERGTTVYEINPDVLGVIRNVLKVRERRLLAKIHLAHREVRSSARRRTSGLNPARMRALGKLIRGASHALDGYLLRQRFDLGLKHFLLK